MALSVCTMIICSDFWHFGRFSVVDIYSRCPKFNHGTKIGNKTFYCVYFENIKMVNSLFRSSYKNLLETFFCQTKVPKLWLGDNNYVLPKTLSEENLSNEVSSDEEIDKRMGNYPVYSVIGK